MKKITCPNCGTSYFDFEKICPQCGGRQNEQPEKTDFQAPARPASPQPPAQSSPPAAAGTYHAPSPDAAAPRQPAAASAQTDLPLKWYRFIIYFQLFLAALSQLGAALQIIVNGVQSVKQFRSLGLDSGSGVLIFFTFAPAVLYLILAGWVIKIRMDLAHFKWKGVTAYYIYNFLLLLAPQILQALAGAFTAHLIYDAAGMLPNQNFAAEITGILIGSLIFFILNKKYFDKRRALFS